MNLERKSSLFIIAACLLWAIDLLVRYPVTLEMNFVSIVFIESALGLIFVGPWLLRNIFQLKKLKKTDWFIVAFIGGIGTTVAGYLQTVGIQKGTPGLFSFFQIFQPLFVIYLARLILKERVSNMYMYWSTWVILSAILMFSVDLELMFRSSDFDWADILIALCTMMIWGLCTILSKKFLSAHSPLHLVSLRWVFAFLFSTIILFAEGEKVPTQILFQSNILMRFVFMAVIAGIGSMYLYYSGIKNLKAGKVSFIEISYAAFGMILSAIYTFEGLTVFQVVGATSFFAFIIFTLFKNKLNTPAIRAR
jgi:drug/metabolite transporter (DMT)-like permease